MCFHCALAEKLHLDRVKASPLVTEALDRGDLTSHHRVHGAKAGIDCLDVICAGLDRHSACPATTFTTPKLGASQPLPCMVKRTALAV